MGLSLRGRCGCGSVAMSRCVSVAVGFLLLVGRCGLSLRLGLVVGQHNIHFKTGEKIWRKARVGEELEPHSSPCAGPY